MDVLDCPVVNVCGGRYRVQGGILARTEEDGPPAKSLSADSGVAAPKISKEDDGYVIKVSADKELYGVINGRGGRTKAQIERETETSIIIPRMGSDHQTEITIQGPSESAVDSARMRLQRIIADFVEKKLDYNYFVSIPLCTSSVINQFKKFQDRVLQEDRARAAGIEASIFQKPEHLHMTIVMLKLYSEEKRHIAQETMKSLFSTVQTILAQQPLQVRLKGLDYMNDDPSTMDVLFLQIKETSADSRLQTVCDEMLKKFSEAGLVQAKDERGVKIHMTLMNSRYRRDPSESKRGEKAPRRPFDGRILMDSSYKDTDFGAVTMGEVHLSQRGKYDPKSGYFHCAKKLNLEA